MGKKRDKTCKTQKYFTGDIDYGQLYAQVIYELLEQKVPYWFNNDEVNEGEVAKTMNCDQLIGMMQRDYPTLENTMGNKVRLGRIVSALGFKYKDHSHVPFYEVIPLRVA